MKKFLFSALIIISGLPVYAWQKVDPPKPTFEMYGMPLGDINHDKVADTAYVTHPKWISEDEYYGNCNDGACSITVTFSVNAPAILHVNAVDAWVKSIGDIDEDGMDEIVVATGWWIGCRGPRYFYTLKNKKWILIGETYHFNCLGDDEEFDPEVKKTARGSFESPTLLFSEEMEDEISVSKTFTIKR